MTFQLLVNSINDQAAVARVTDSSDVEVAAEQPNISVITGGPRHLQLAQSGTAARRYVYINKTTAMSFDSLVMVRADRHVGHSVAFRWWSNYTSTSTDISTSSNWAPTLVGPLSQDYIVTGLSVSTAQAAGVVLDSGSGGAYTKKLAQLFFANSFSFPQPPAVRRSVVFGPIVIGRQHYLIDERITFSWPLLTRAQVNTLQQLPRLLSEPCFIYDSSGRFIPEKLLHIMITKLSVVAEYNDLHRVEMECFLLRQYA